MMYQCYTDISQAQLAVMQASTPELVIIIKREGGLTLQDFIDRGIEPGQTTIDRGLLNHVRHWSEIINHDKVVARYELERLAKDPATIARKKAEAVIQQAADKQAKADAESARKALAKNIESHRVSMLTPQAGVEKFPVFASISGFIYNIII
jgi:hypothetical protein